MPPRHRRPGNTLVYGPCPNAASGARSPWRPHGRFFKRRPRCGVRPLLSIGVSPKRPELGSQTDLFLALRQPHFGHEGVGPCQTPDFQDEPSGSTISRECRTTPTAARWPRLRDGSATSAASTTCLPSRYADQRDRHPAVLGRAAVQGDSQSIASLRIQSVDPIGHARGRIPILMAQPVASGPHCNS